MSLDSSYSIVLPGGPARAVSRAVIPAAAAALATWFLGDAAGFLMPLRAVGVLVGVAGIAVGLLLGTTAIIVANRARSRGRFPTAGAYGYCRHPVVASWGLFLLPGVAFVLDSWPFIVAALVFLLASRSPAHLLDDYLSAQSGYAEYRSTTRFLLPLPRLGGRSRDDVRPVVSGLLLGAAAVVGALVLVGRPLVLRLGVPASVARGSFPGDRFIDSPDVSYTQGITIDSPPAAVWPWVVQSAYRSAGWHDAQAILRYAALDFFYESDRSAGRTIPELQDLSPDSGASNLPTLGLYVMELVEHQRIVMAAEPSNPTAPDNAVLAYVLQPTDSGGTRLTVRVSLREQQTTTVPQRMAREMEGALLRQPTGLWRIKHRTEELYRAATKASYQVNSGN